MNETLHDFTTTRWGHNFSLIKNNGDDTFEFWVWVTPRIQVGHRVKWTTAYGSAILEATDVKHTPNVFDMAKVTARLVDRIVK